MMAIETRTAARRRTAEALTAVSGQYGLDDDLEALERAGDDWEPLAIAMLAEAVAALLLDVRPRPGTVERRAR